MCNRNHRLNPEFIKHLTRLDCKLITMEPAPDIEMQMKRPGPTIPVLKKKNKILWENIWGFKLKDLEEGYCLDMAVEDFFKKLLKDQVKYRIDFVKHIDESWDSSVLPEGHPFFKDNNFKSTSLAEKKYCMQRKPIDHDIFGFADSVIPLTVIFYIFPMLFLFGTVWYLNGTRC